MGADLPRCAVCRVAVEPGQNVMFRADGRIEHHACPEVVCPVCLRPIRPTDPIRRDGDAMLHGNCWIRRTRATPNGRAPDGPTIREKLIAKLQAGALPHDLPEKVGGGFGGDQACSVCDGPILSAQVAYIYERSEGQTLRLHIGCYGLWQAELRRRGLKRDH